MKLASKRKGWRFEEVRHSLAAKGIKTGRKKPKSQPVVLNISQRELDQYAIRPYVRSTYTPEVKRVMSGVQNGTMDVHAMIFHKHETAGRPVILLSKRLKKHAQPRLGLPSKKRTLKHELLHAKYPNWSERRIVKLERTGKGAIK